MKKHFNSVDDYIESLDSDRQEVIQALRKVLNANLPKGFVEEISYGMVGYVVPHSLYPEGYHVNPKSPLPFINIASQKRHIGFYHMALYSNKELLYWFVDEYFKIVGKKPDVGKSCIRFKKMDQMPYELIGQLVQKLTPQDWIKEYENSINLKK